MKIKFKHIILTLVLSFFIMLGIGLTAQATLPRQEFLDSFYNHGLVVCIAWCIVAIAISIVIRVYIQEI